MKVALGLVLVAVVGSLLGCSQQVPNTTTPEEPANTDPKVGWVLVRSDAKELPGSDQLSYPPYKICDGPTLVYAKHAYEGGVAVIPNSPECK